MGLIIDLFAGGGGVSTAIEMALGRSPDIAINHSATAVAMHRENHPDTLHYCQDVCDIQPTHVVKGQPVDLLWASPDCTHFSKAKGGKPRDQKIRDLAWIIVKWAEQVRPNLICMENVEEFQTWGALDKEGYPIEADKGATFRAWKRALRRAGYKIEHKELRACDYGAPTIRKRFFLVARRDGQPICWPKPTHGKGLLPYRTAADCIDWSEPACSIFATKDEAAEWAKKHEKGRPVRPLADNTMRRVARGVKKYVIDDPDPFIVEDFIPTLVQTGYGERKGQQPRVPGLDKPLGTVVSGGGKHALVMNKLAPFIQHVQHSSAVNGTMAANEPMRTITATPKGGGMALITPFVAKHYGGVIGSSIDSPLGTVTTVDHNSVVAAFLSRQFGQSVGCKANCPAPTIMPNGGGKSAVSMAYMQKMRGQNTGSKLASPLHTISAGGQHHAYTVAHLIAYYGAEQEGIDLRKPMRTATTKDRFGLVTVNIEGETYVMTDIAMRMLTPRELYRAQGFPETYIINQAGGKKLSKAKQVRMCGNSVPPPLAAALIKANSSEEKNDIPAMDMPLFKPEYTVPSVQI